MKVRLNIDEIEENLYLQLLSAFFHQFGLGDYNDWDIIATKEAKDENNRHRTKGIRRDTTLHL